MTTTSQIILNKNGTILHSEYKPIRRFSNYDRFNENEIQNRSDVEKSRDVQMSRNVQTNTEVQKGSDLLKPFCELVQPSTPIEKGSMRTSYWSAHTVQREIGSLLDTPAFRNSPHSAYLHVYKKMTAARDLARCTKGNPMYPTKPLDRRLNDALSDLMTRNYLEIVGSAVATPEKEISFGLDIGGNFRRMHATAKQQNWDSVRVALGGTGLYLTQHLSVALSTLPHLDELWVGTPYKDLPSRIQRVKEFKPTFDAFNSFLAKNLVTVANALQEAKLLNGNTLSKVTKIAEPIIPTHLLFGAIRDRAFDIGLSIAKNTPKGQHPWTVCDENGHIKMANRLLDAPAFPKNVEVQKDLSKLERLAWQTSLGISNPLTGIFKGKDFLNSKIYKDMTIGRIGPNLSKNSAQPHFVF